MKNTEAEKGTPLPLGQFVKMTAPIFLFGVILPFVDMVTDLRMIIRLYVGVQGCSANQNAIYACRRVEPQDFEKFCEDYPGNCSTEQHTIFASMLLGMYKTLP